MDSGDYSAPPSFPSRSIDPQFPANSQTTVTGENATQAPCFSSTGIRSSEPQFTADGQRTVAGEYYVQAPSYTAFQHGTGNSATQFTDFNNGYRESVQTEYGDEAPNLDATVHENNSATTGFNDYNDYEQPPSYKDADPRNASNPGDSVAANFMVNPQENLGMSLTRRHFRNAKLKAFYTDKDVY